MTVGGYGDRVNHSVRANHGDKLVVWSVLVEQCMATGQSVVARSQRAATA